MKRNMMIGAVLVAALSMASLSMAATYTWTGADNNWSNSANWAGGTLPAVTGAGYVGGGNHTIVVAGGVNPSVNVPDMAQGALGESPKVTLAANTALGLTWAPGAGWNGIKGSGTMATVGSGATLTYNLENYVGYAALARDPAGIPLQTYNVNGGDLVFNHGGRLDLAFNDTRTSAFNLDNGDVVFDHRYGSTTGAPFMEVWGYGNDSGSATVASTIALDNASTFGIARFNRTKWASGNAAMIFDILDENSTVNISTSGGDYTTLAAVVADFGSVFKSSALGDANLQAVEAGGVITVSVIPEPATLGLVAIMGAGLIATRRIFKG